MTKGSHDVDPTAVVHTVTSVLPMANQTTSNTVG